MGTWTKTITGLGEEYDSWSTFKLVDPKKGMEALRDMFPDGKADYLNFVLFSTSGVHGTANTIDEVEENRELESITFLVVQPRIVTLRYGNCYPKNRYDFVFLKCLRRSSTDIVTNIGY